MQRSVCDNVLVPELSKYLTYDNGASMEGKGIHFARIKECEAMGQLDYLCFFRIDKQPILITYPSDVVQEPLQELLALCLMEGWCAAL